MLSDLEALIPPLVVGGAFVAGVVLFLRRQLGPASGATDDRAGAEIPDDGRNAGRTDRPPATSADHGKV